jgi:hypothetical protein
MFTVDGRCENLLYSSLLLLEHFRNCLVLNFDVHLVDNELEIFILISNLWLASSLYGLFEFLHLIYYVLCEILLE